MDIKERIIREAWALFRKKGYDATTVDDIVKAANTSKGTYYYYFGGKSSMLDTFSVMLDLEYKKLRTEIDSEMNSFDKLIYMNASVHTKIEEMVSTDLLGALYSTQIVKRDDRTMLDKNREFYRMLSDIVEEGQSRGQISRNYTAREIAWYYAMCEHGLIYDWCLRDEEESLAEISKKYMPLMMEHFRGHDGHED